VIVLFAMVTLALVGYARGSQTIRFSVLGMALLHLGYLKGGGLSIHDAINVFEGHLPLFSATVYWYTLVLFVALSSVLIGRFYCGWLCPFGALTEMLYRALWRIRANVSFGVDRSLRLLKYFVLTSVLLAVVLVGQSRLTSSMIDVVEPFGTLFRASGSLLSWLMVGLFIIGSVLVLRAYCRYVCPLGAVFALVTLVVSFVKHSLFKITPGPRHYGSAVSVGGCPMAAVRHESDSSRVGVRSGECIVCSPPTEHRRPITITQAAKHARPRDLS
jgi:polyferredoxin